MTATNHALTGALIGLLVKEPAVAIPAALASHFICDAIPHYGTSGSIEEYLRKKGFRYYLFIDAFVCFLIVAILAIMQPAHWGLAVICAFVATSPDFLHISYFRQNLKGKKYHPPSFLKWTWDIQWFQRPIGALVEVAWFVGAVTLLLPFVR